MQVSTPGGTITKGDVTVLPSSTKMSGALVRMQPGAGWRCVAVTPALAGSVAQERLAGLRRSALPMSHWTLAWRVCASHDSLCPAVPVAPAAVKVPDEQVGVAGALRQLHWHLNLDEWQYLHRGTLQARWARPLCCSCILCILQHSHLLAWRHEHQQLTCQAVCAAVLSGHLACSWASSMRPAL